MTGPCTRKRRWRSIFDPARIDAGDDECSPSFENDSLFQDEAMRSGARFDRSRLGVSQAGWPGNAASRDVPAQSWRKRIERAVEQIGEEEIGLDPPQARMAEPVSGHDVEEGSGAVLARIVGGGPGSDLVVVARDDFA